MCGIRVRALFAFFRSLFTDPGPTSVASAHAFDRLIVSTYRLFLFAKQRCVWPWRGTHACGSRIELRHFFSGPTMEYCYKPHHSMLRIDDNLYWRSTASVHLSLASLSLTLFNSL